MVSLRLGNSILPDLVEQSFVADLKNSGSLLTVPVGLFQGLGNSLRFGFIFGGARQRLQAARFRSPGRDLAGPRAQVEKSNRYKKLRA